MTDVEYTNGYHQEDFQDEDITDTNEENSDDEKPRSRSSQNNNNNEDNSMSVDSKPRTLSRDENTAPLRASRHSSTTSDGDDYNNQSASDRRNKWEKKAGRGFSFDKSRVRAQGGSTGASTLKARFENKAIESKKVVTTSNNPNSRLNSEGGENEERHSALSLKARFESKIQDSAPVKRNFVINRTGGAAKKFGGGGGGPVNNKCQVCTKTVYPMEKLEADGHVYHKFCFKCKTCGRTVGLGNYAALQGDIYCKPHLKQLFKLKGNYDEGFGREQRKADWVKKEKNENETNAGGESAPVEGVQDGE